MLEKEVEKYLSRQCRKRGWMCLKFVSPSTAGVPDRIILTDHCTKFVELKRPKGGVISPLQKVTFEKFDRHGHPVAIVRNREDVDDLIGSLERSEKFIRWCNEID